MLTNLILLAILIVLIGIGAAVRVGFNQVIAGLEAIAATAPAQVER